MLKNIKYIYHLKRMKRILKTQKKLMKKIDYLDIYFFKHRDAIINSMGERV